jgi:hypothetical protein
VGKHGTFSAAESAERVCWICRPRWDQNLAGCSAQTLSVWSGFRSSGLETCKRGVLVVVVVVFVADVGDLFCYGGSCCMYSETSDVMRSLIRVLTSPRVRGLQSETKQSIPSSLVQSSPIDTARKAKNYE